MRTYPEYGGKLAACVALIGCLIFFAACSQSQQFVLEDMIPAANLELSTNSRVSIESEVNDPIATAPNPAYWLEIEMGGGYLRLGVAEDGSPAAAPFTSPATELTASGLGGVNEPFTMRFNWPYWFSGAEHIYLGEVTVGDYVFAGAIDYPLLFKVIEDEGYVYVAGRGSVTTPNGESVQLGTDDTIETWLRRTSSDDALEREGAAYALGYLATGASADDKAEVIEKLVEMLADPAPVVRRGSVESIVRLQAIDTMPALEELSERETDNWAKEVVLWALLELNRVSIFGDGGEPVAANPTPQATAPPTAAPPTRTPTAVPPTRTPTPPPPTTTPTAIPPTPSPVLLAPKQRITTETLISQVDFSVWVPGSFQVSSDYRHVAHIAQASGGQSVVADGREGPLYDLINPGTLQFAPTSGRVAYAAQEGGKWLVVVDGVEGRPYDAIGELRFSPDGSRLGYTAQAAEAWFVVLDGVEGKRYDTVEQLVFSPDGGQMTYVATDGLSQFVVIDGQEGLPYERIQEDSLQFDWDGDQLAYAAQREGKWLVVVNGAESEPVDAVGGLQFVPRLEWIAYEAQSGGSWFVFVTDEIVAQYTEISRLTFSLDGRKAAYVAFDGVQRFALINGVAASGHHNRIRDLAFSPDGNQITYVASESEAYFALVDGKDGVPYEAEYFTFGGQTYSRIPLDNRQRVFTSGSGGTEYFGIRRPIFSPDGDWLAYVAGAGELQQPEGQILMTERFVVVNGEEGRRYDGILGQDSFVFDAPNRFHYIAIRGKDIYLVEEILGDTESATGAAEDVIFDARLYDEVLAKWNTSFAWQFSDEEVQYDLEESANGVMTRYIESGVYHLELVPARPFQYLDEDSIPSQGLGDFALFVDTLVLEGNSGASGVYFRGNDESGSFYSFAMSGNQEFFITYYTGTTNDLIQDWTFSPLIRDGDLNKLGIIAIDDEVGIWINDTFVTSITIDSTHEAASDFEVGLYGVVLDDQVTLMVFDNIELLEP